MAIVVTSDKTLIDSTDRTGNYTVTSWTPTAGRVFFAGVFLSTTASTPDTPTLVGNGMTWTQITNGTFNGGNWRLTTFWAYDPAPTTGTLIVTLGGSTTHTGCMVSIAGCANAFTDGSPIVASNGAGGSTSPATATVGAFSGTAMIAFTANGGNAITPGTDFTELSELSMATPASRLQLQWWANPTDGIVDSTFTNTAWRIAGINVKDAVIASIPLMFKTRDV